MILPTCHPFCRRSAAVPPALRRLCERLARDGGGRARGQGALGRPVPTSPRKMGEIVGGGRNQAGCAAGSRTFWQLSLGDFCRNVRELASAVARERPFRRRTLVAIGGYGVTAYGRVEGTHPSRGAGRCLEALTSGLRWPELRGETGCGSCCAWLRRARSLVANDPSARHRFSSNELRR